MCDCEYISSIEEMESEIINQQRIHEDLQQESFDMKNNIIRQDLMDMELEPEIERLHMELKNSGSEMTERIKKKEIQLNMQWSSNINNLQILIDKNREMFRKMVGGLNDKITDLEFAVHSNDSPSKENCDTLVEKISDLSTEKTKLEEKCSECRMLLENYENRNSILKNEIKSLEENFIETKYVLESKSQSLRETMNALQDAQEEKALLSSELAVLKAGPIGEIHRGNSLFAEVNDRSNSLETSLQIMRTKYNELKRILLLKKNENNKLKAEKIHLLHSWQEGNESKSTKEYEKLQEAYHKQIEDLKSTLHRLEQHSDSPEIIISKSDLTQLQWVRVFMEQARAETRDLQKTIKEKFNQQIYDAEQLYLAQKELRKLKVQSITNDAMMEELYMKLAEGRSSVNDTTSENGKEETNLNKTEESDCRVKTEITKRGVSFADNVKEDDGTTKFKELKRIPKQKSYPKISFSL